MTDLCDGCGRQITEDRNADDERHDVSDLTGLVAGIEPGTYHAECCPLCGLPDGGEQLDAVDGEPFLSADLPRGHAL